MTQKIVPLLLVLVSLLLPGDFAVAAGLEIGQPVVNFTLEGPGPETSFQALLDSEGTKAVVVAVTSYTCPYSLRADEELIPLSAELAEQGVRVLAIYPNRHETADGVNARAKAKSFTHKAVRDSQGKTARMLGAEVTPTCFLFDSTGILRYRGNLMELSVAVDAVLAGEAVARAKTAATGCTVKWPDGKVPEAPVPPRPDVPEQPPRPDAGGIGRGPPSTPQPGDGRPDRRPPNTPRPGDGRPDRRPPGGGPRPGAGEGPPPLSDGATAWLSKLLEMLDTDDPAVLRSAAAGISALGPAVLPHLERARKGAEGRKAQMLDRILQQLRRGRRPGAGPDRPDARPGGRFREGGRRFSFLDFQVRMIEENIDLSEEQRQALKDVLGPLKEREAEILKKRESGADRESIRAEAVALMEEARVALLEILTPEQRQKLEQLRGKRLREGGRRPGERRPEGGERDR